MKALLLTIGCLAVASLIHTCGFANQQTSDKKPVYLENIYFGLNAGTSQWKIKDLAEYILSNHGIHADINVSM